MLSNVSVIASLDCAIGTRNNESQYNRKTHFNGFLGQNIGPKKRRKFFITKTLTNGIFYVYQLVRCSDCRL